MMNRGNMMEKPEYLTWELFEEFLKSNVPWPVYNMNTIGENLTFSDKPPRQLRIAELKLWEQEKRIYIIYKMEQQQQKMQQIFLRPRFSEEVEKYANMVSDIFLRNKQTQKPTLQSTQQIFTNAEQSKTMNMKDLHQRPVINYRDKKGVQQEQNQQAEVEKKKPAIINQIVFEKKSENETNEEREKREQLKQKFFAIYSRFEDENK